MVFKNNEKSPTTVLSFCKGNQIDSSGVSEDYGIGGWLWCLVGRLWVIMPS